MVDYPVQFVVEVEILILILLLMCNDGQHKSFPIGSGKDK